LVVPSSYRTLRRLFLADQPRQIDRSRIVGDGREAGGHLILGESRLAKLALDVAPNRLPRARELPRGGRFVLLEHAARLGERQLLHVITPEAQPIAWRQPRDGARQPLAQRGHVAAAFRIRRRGGGGR